MSNRGPLSDLFDVAKLVGKGLVGDLSDKDLRRVKEQAGGAAPTVDPCPRCDGEREVVVKSVVVPCPLCCAEGR